MEMKSRLALVSLMFAIVFGTGCDQKNHESGSAISSSSPVGAALTATPQQFAKEPVTPWHYSSDQDEMSDKKRQWACSSSPDGADLCFRKTGKTLESYIRFNSVSDGQFLCSDDCSVSIRFDGGPVVHFRGVEAAGGTTTMLFIEPTGRLISGVRKAKSLKIQPPVYENSGQVIHFDVDRLTW